MELGSGSESESIERLLQQFRLEEEELQFPSFTNDTALELGNYIISEAKRLGKNITLDITRQGQRLFVHAMAGTTAGNEDWVRRKNNVVGRFGISTFHFKHDLLSRGTTMEEAYNLPSGDYTPSGGAFPLKVSGEGVVGTITVSGLPDDEDHDLVVRSLRSFLSGA